MISCSIACVPGLVLVHVLVVAFPVFAPIRFSPTCSSQVPSYVEQYEAFKAKGVTDIYVVAVNDMFVVNAWKEKLLGEGKQGPVKFSASDRFLASWL